MAGRRARGANALMSLAINPAAYGAIPASGSYYRMPFVSSDLGEEQPLLESDLLGQGREPGTPSLDVPSEGGNTTVPVDLRYFGLWLTLMFGAPTTTQGVAATGSYVFSDQPAETATLTVNGQVFTFVTGDPAANEIEIGATLAETINNAVEVLNASAVAGVAAASYEANLDGDTILITYDAIGVGGNAFTIVAEDDPASNATPSGATLAGGSGAGPYNHVFTSGAQDLPDAAVEIGFPEVPSFGMNRGVVLNTMQIAAQRQGHLNAVLGLVGQGEEEGPATIDETPTEMQVDRFSQWSGGIYLNGVPAADLVSATFNFSNGADEVAVIRQDGRNGGFDAAGLTASVAMGLRFRDRTYLQKATSQTPVELRIGWRISDTQRLVLRLTRMFLPKAKRPVTGPGGVQLNLTAQAAKDLVTGHAVFATLINDVPSYDYTA